MSIQGLYNSIAFIYTTSYTIGTYGNQIESLSLKYSGIPCYITYLSGQKQVYVGKNQVLATHRLFCNPQLSLKSSDKVYISGNETWYNVLYVDNCNQMGHHIELLLEQIGDQDIGDLSSRSSSSIDSSSSSSSEG